MQPDASSLDTLFGTLHARCDSAAICCWHRYPLSKIQQNMIILTTIKGHTIRLSLKGGSCDSQSSLSFSLLTAKVVLFKTTMKFFFILLLMFSCYNLKFCFGENLSKLRVICIVSDETVPISGKFLKEIKTVFILWIYVVRRKRRFIPGWSV